MRCLECKKSEFEYDESMGETSCVSCGLIAVTEMFEERTISMSKDELHHSPDRTGLGSKILGHSNLAKTHMRFSGNDSHIKKGILFSNMVFSNIGVYDSSLKDRIAEVYRELLSKSIFTSANTLEVRGTAVTWFVLKENKTPVTIKEATKEFNCGGKSLNRLIRRINSYYGGRNKYLQPDPLYLLKKAANKIDKDIVYISRCQETLELFESILSQSEYNKRNAYYESICWIAKNIFVHPRITLQGISEKTGTSRSAIQKQTKDLLNLIGYKTCAQVKGKQISELGENKYE
tara:strand:- start:505 stop:1374 length:870 start_codon:yes stop_codon:yes gene_type:complete